ncbi:high-affinity nitrate transporter 3.1-like [Cornus florida]|uniref:high-affinity nitrate transporter 3.1-like n=1 Tax=Cornus florida TaxID=4283 RepID=UPI00289C00BF|nr:high-affinity nitrate transporter 3.1-like [Cornus florida]
MKSHFSSTFLILFCLARTCYGGVLFSSLPQTLVVSASPKQGQVLKAGEDNINVTWWLNQSFAAGTDESYKDVKVKLCYAPISQVDRSWRKTVDNMDKDKTCQFTIVNKPYERKQSIEWSIAKEVPTATYFVRAYAYNSAGKEVAYGQTTHAKKSINLFEIQAIGGRHLSLDIASVCFSVFSLVSLLGFFLIEKTKRSPNK